MSTCEKNYGITPCEKWQWMKMNDAHRMIYDIHKNPYYFLKKLRFSECVTCIYVCIAEKSLCKDRIDLWSITENPVF